MRSYALVPFLLLAAPGFSDSVDQGAARKLEHLVIQDCGSCHGLTRKGGLGSPLTQEALEGSDPAVLAAIILDGVPGTAMPPWRPLLSEDEAMWIAQYLLKGPEQ